MQKTTRENTQCQRNETILKIGHLAFYDILITIITGLLVPKSKMVSILHIIDMARLWCWTSMLFSIATCQNKISANLYHVTMSRAQI